MKAQGFGILGAGLGFDGLNSRGLALGFRVGREGFGELHFGLRKNFAGNSNSNRTSIVIVIVLAIVIDMAKVIVSVNWLRMPILGWLMQGPWTRTWKLRFNSGFYRP